MATKLAAGSFQSQLNLLSTLGVVGDLTDGQLLERCLSTHEGCIRAAFTALVERHGPMVKSVCRDVLGDSHDVEDAFQATFLVLFRKAGSVRNGDSVASWLHGVAYRVGMRARADAFRRKVHEQRGAEMRAARKECESRDPDSWSELHGEISRLPLCYREPLVLCYLEGLTTEAVAQRLGCPQGTILSRLSRGRERLRARLTRRGLAPACIRLGVSQPGEAGLMAVPGQLLAGTVQLVSRKLDETLNSGIVSARVASLADGIMQAMLWSKLKASLLVVVGLATLIVGAEAAFAFQESKSETRVPSRKAVQDRAKPDAKPADPQMVIGPSARIFAALPSRDELHRLLRRASAEAVVLAKAKPNASSWTLTMIAAAQAKAGDKDGARATFADAATEAEGGFGGAASSWNLWRVGHGQAECGLKDEARATLQRALKAIPGVVGDFQKDYWVVQTYSVMVQEQAAIGARDEARKSADLLLDFSAMFFASTQIGNARDTAAPLIAAALAAAGDFKAAFAWSDDVENSGNVVGEIALAASKALDREAAKKFVAEAAARLAKMPSADQTYSGLSGLAEAQARLGDLNAAKKSALAIGEGPIRANYDMTDGQTYALIRVAGVQHYAGDSSGARETLRAAFRSVRDHPKMRGRDGRLSQVVMGQIANGDTNGALQSVDAMSGNRAQSLALIARAQAAAGNEAAARATFARALSDADLSVKNPRLPNPDLAKMPGINQNMPAVERMQLAEIQSMSGDTAGALKTIRSIDDQNYQRSALNRVVSIRATAGDVADALRLSLEESRTPEERSSALEGLGQGVDDRLSLKPPR